MEFGDEEMSVMTEKKRHCSPFAAAPPQIKFSLPLVINLGDCYHYKREIWFFLSFIL